MSRDNSACLFVQPGFGPEIDWAATATGPQVPARRPVDNRLRADSFHFLDIQEPDLEPKLDPPDWYRPNRLLAEDQWDWNKVGGTPLWLQGDATPQGKGWRFLFQFTAGYVGHELGDGAECYGFVSDTGHGIFLWQCH